MIAFLRRSWSRSCEALRRAVSGRPRLVAGVVVAVAVVAWGLAGWLAWFTWDMTSGLPGRADIGRIGDMAQATTIYDIANRPVFTVFKEQRIEVPLSRVSPLLVKAVIPVEDQRFYEHRGVDFVRIAASALANLRSGRKSQGGSTITQQLARLSLLSRDKTYRRKLKEVLLAAQIEHAYDKKEILELYLNKVYLGEGFYGVEAASLGYFGKHAFELSVEEAALIAGLAQSPSAYAPTANLQKAIARRNVVLRTMLDTGSITAATYERARGAGVTLRDRLRREESFGLYFKEQVRRELVDRFGWERVSEGGLKVFTTIDSGLQQEAERLVEESLQTIEARPTYKHAARAKLGPLGEDESPDYLQAAVVVLDPQSGEVRALVGGRDYKESRFNRAVQAKRQPGSAFKPFVFAAAIENGFTPATVLANLNDPVWTPQGAWVPEDEHLGADSMTLRTALRTSSNRAAVQLLRKVGIDKTVDYAKRLDVGTVPSVPSIALGAGEVTLMSMTSAYAAFGNGGVVHKPVLIRRVEDSDGATLSETTLESHRAISETTAFLMATMLADVINGGTGWRARQQGFTLPAAGKTGTTNDYHDAWFVGFTPSVVAGVWIGFDQPKTIIQDGYAGELAVPLWASLMKVATRGQKPQAFERPANVVAVDVCRMSGKLPSDGCTHVEVLNDAGGVETKSMVYTEYFARGTAPTGTCDLHPSASFFQRVAGAFGKDTGPAPVPAADSGLPPTHDRVEPRTEGSPAADGRGAHAGAAEPEAERADTPKKKRGFWGRLFGSGDKKDKDEKKDKERKPEPREPGQP